MRMLVLRFLKYKKVVCRMTKSKWSIVWGVLIFLVVTFIWWIFGSRAIEKVYVSERGSNADFYLVWRGADEIWQGNTPYTDEITREIQINLLGHTVEAGENEYRFVYPAYEAFVFLPFTALDYLPAYLHWLTFQPVLLFLALFLVIKPLSWELSPLSLAGLMLAGFSFRYFWIGMSLAQTSVFILALFALSGYLAWRGYDLWAALPLALATVKPQLAFFPILGWVVWMLARRQWRGVLWAGGMGVALVALPLPWIGFWLPGFYRQISTYWNYTGADSPLTLLIFFLLDNAARTAILVVGLLAGVLYLIWLARRSKDWMPVLSASIVLTIALVPLSYVYDIVLLLLPWLYILHALSQLKGRKWRALQIATATIPLWSWGIILFLQPFFATQNWIFNAAAIDKMLIPITLLMIFLFVEKQSQELRNVR